jgi:SulP family sulfate permease
MTGEIQPDRLVPGLIAGLVAGIIIVIVAISLAALIFAGDLSGFVSRGISLFLMGGIAALIATGLLSSFSGTITLVQDAPAAVMAVVAAAIVSSLPASASSQEKFMTVVGAIALTSLLTGLLLILLGRFKLGALVRFLPYPVVGGFLAGTGWLLVTGGIGVMTDVSFSFSHLGALFQPDMLLRWVPGLVIAVLMLAILNRYNHFLLLPGMLLGLVVLFYGIVWLTRTPVAQVSAQGWLLGPFPMGGLLQPVGPSDLVDVQWTAILGQAGNLASILLVSVVSLLLNTSGVELVIERDLDLNRELEAAGVGNLLAGLLGGSVNYHALTNITLNYRLSRGSRLAGWVAAGFCGLVLLLGATMLSFVPKLVLGTLLVLLGLSFLYEWVYQAWTKFPRVEYLVILLILVVIATAGYLQGVGLGILVAVGLFAASYSRINVVKHALSGAEYLSQVTRSSRQRQALVEHGDGMFILQLQGYIFFGTANNLLEQVRERVGQGGSSSLRFVILDFRQVTGLDSTAMLSFTKMKQVARKHGFTLLITAPSSQIRQQLDMADFTASAEDGALVFPDLDHGLEWCENQILETVGLPMDDGGQTIEEQLRESLPVPAGLDSLLAYLERLTVDSGTYLMRQGDSPDYVYFVEDGQVTARLEREGEDPVRLETMRSGRVVGELGFYLGKVRTAAVVADETCTVYRLSLDGLEQMEREAPEGAFAFHRIIIHLLAERASHLIRTVSALQR